MGVLLLGLQHGGAAVETAQWRDKAFALHKQVPTVADAVVAAPPVGLGSLPPDDPFAPPPQQRQPKAAPPDDPFAHMHRKTIALHAAPQERGSFPVQHIFPESLDARQSLMAQQQAHMSTLAPYLYGGRSSTGPISFGPLPYDDPFSLHRANVSWDTSLQASPWVAAAPTPSSYVPYADDDLQVAWMAPVGQY